MRRLPPQTYSRQARNRFSADHGLIDLGLNPGSRHIADPSRSSARQMVAIVTIDIPPWPWQNGWARRRLAEAQNVVELGPTGSQGSCGLPTDAMHDVAKTFDRSH
jgi:hypothetical protein